MRNWAHILAGETALMDLGVRLWLTPPDLSDPEGARPLAEPEREKLLVLAVRVGLIPPDLSDPKGARPLAEPERKELHVLATRAGLLPPELSDPTLRPATDPDERDAAAEKVAQLGDLARRNLLTEEELQRLDEEARLRRALAALEQEMAKLTAAVARLTGQTVSEVEAAANVQGNEYARERASAQGVVLEPLVELCLSANGALVWLRARQRAAAALALASSLVKRYEGKPG